jgi:hypothetical protein
MNQHEINKAMVRAGIDLDKLHKLTPAQLHQLEVAVIRNEKMIDAAVKMTRRHMTTSLFRR